MGDTFIAQVDGQTFLSQEELDEYWALLASQEYEQRERTD
jgi:hypothetical protein